MQRREPRRASWADVRSSAHLWPRLRDDATLATLHWHSHALRSNSSQVFCINAFRGLAQLTVCHTVLDRLFAQAFPARAEGAATWHIEVEKEDPALLGEGGPQQPTSIDAFCSTSKSVVCVESKFDRDGRDGFGCCSQAAGDEANCKGFFGLGSDAKTQTLSPCRLQVAEGSRTARLYWRLAIDYFSPDVFALQTAGQQCPFKGSSFQLMRNFLFAAAHARAHGLAAFHVLAICPTRWKTNLEGQVGKFHRLLLPEFQDRVALTTYEDFISILRATGDEAQPLATFLAKRISEEIKD